jgi:hypothetical protein
MAAQGLKTIPSNYGPKDTNPAWLAKWHELGVETQALVSMMAGAVDAVAKAATTG